MRYDIQSEIDRQDSTHASIHFELRHNPDFKPETYRDAGCYKSGQNFYIPDTSLTFPAGNVIMLFGGANIYGRLADNLRSSANQRL